MLAITMFAVFPCSRLLAFCRDYLVVGISAAFGCLPCGAATAVPGQLDPTFGAGGVVYAGFTPYNFNFGRSAVLMKNGKILAAGDCRVDYYDTDPSPCYFRVLADGTPDTTFGVGGQVFLPSEPSGTIHKLIRDSKDRILATQGNCVRRFTPTGETDTSFGGNGTFCLPSVGVLAHSEFYELAETANGKILMGGACNGFGWPVFAPFDLCLAQLAETGTLDSAFGDNGVARVNFPGFSARAYSLTVLRSGRIVLAGGCLDSERYATAGSICAAALLPDGSIDAGFAISGKFTYANFVNPTFAASWATSVVFAAALTQSDGVVFSGSCAQQGACLISLTEHGEFVTTFGFGGVAALNAPNTYPTFGNGVGLAIQPDGRILLSSYCPGLCIVRTDASGQIDMNFGQNGAAIITTFANDQYYPTKRSISFTQNGDIVFVGSCAKLGEYYTDVCIAKIKRGPYDPLSCALNADANQTIGPATDATLITRYLLGFRGAALTTGALGQNPTRTGQTLETYLASLNLDADGDGQALAMTDGLLTVRAMLGLTGTALTQGATNASHPNVRNAQQILTWIESTHGVACLP